MKKVKMKSMAMLLVAIMFVTAILAAFPTTSKASLSSGGGVMSGYSAKGIYRECDSEYYL